MFIILLQRHQVTLEVLDAYYMKFIVSNLKLILKGKVLGKSQEEIETHVNLHAEELIKQRDIVVKALVAKDLEEAVANLNQFNLVKTLQKQQHYTMIKKTFKFLTHILIKFCFTSCRCNEALSQTKMQQN